MVFRRTKFSDRVEQSIEFALAHQIAIIFVLVTSVP